MKFLQIYFFIADSIPIDVWNEPLNVKIQNSTFLNFICRRDIFVLQMQCIKIGWVKSEQICGT